MVKTPAKKAKGCYLELVHQRKDKGEFHVQAVDEKGNKVENGNICTLYLKEGVIQLHGGINPAIVPKGKLSELIVKR